MKAPYNLLLLLLLLSLYVPHARASDQNITVADFKLQNNIHLIDHYNYNNNITFNHWIDNEIDVCHKNILLNIKQDDNNNNNTTDHFYPHGNEINNGVIIASPQHNMPNYFFQWTRDSAITAYYLISNNNQSQNNILISHYINNSYILQRVNNTSGNFSAADKWANLGEPKFYCNNTPFNLNWGRPQNDGPALRLISILTHLLNQPSQNNHSSVLTDICQFDAKYILSHWNQKSFDPWEEIFSFHFFNHMVHLYALKLYQHYYPTNPDHKQIVSTIHTIEAFINKYYIDYNLNLIVETPNLWDQRPSHLDIAVLIASLITHPLTINSTSPLNQIKMPFDTDNLMVLNVLYKLMQEMKSLYPINKNLHAGHNAAIALGRYPEDIYDGIHTSSGNPWFLATCQGANILYRLVHSLHKSHNDLKIALPPHNNNNNNNFWSLFFKQQHQGNTNTLTLPYHSKAFNETITQILNIADGFIQIIKTHVNDKGEMSEQFNKDNGFLTGASNLTWSYVEFINAINARNTILNYYA